ncbi:hypothetical protein LUZ60_006596 [Juncus effusus]|nr:hypothetical protein LUZ60_006596 [Juncus effusus]
MPRVVRQVWGVIYKPTTHPRNLSPEVRYAFLKANVDVLKLVQFGLTLSNSKNRSAITWEFNFREFDPCEDPCSPDSVMLLQSQGIDFMQNRIWGIDSRHFAELLWTSSGLFTDYTNISWITFHGAYDFGYMIKVLSGKMLPETIDEFSRLTRSFFGYNIFDIKYLIKSCDINLYGGLEKVGEALNIERATGKSHQAGSDSFLTWQVYQKIREDFLQLDGGITHAGILFGLHEQ